MCLKRKKPAAIYFPAKAVSSTLESLTSVFGMGTGIASPLWPLAFITNSFPLRQKLYKISHLKEIKTKEEIFNNNSNRNDNMVKPHDLLVLLG